MLTQHERGTRGARQPITNPPCCDAPGGTMSTMTKDLYALAEAPPLGQVPATMHAMTIRQDRFGEPKSAFQPEVVPVPEIGPREALVYVMAAGINYNNVWAALGTPVDVIKARAAGGDTTGFHIGGSDASGIVY